MKINIPIWKKWILKDSIKFILFFLLCIYIIYFTIDFSIHGSKLFSKAHISIIQIAIFYCHNFVLFLNIFLMIALMFAIIKVIYGMNISNELVALRASGISKLALSTPLFIIAATISLISYANNELFIPSSTKAIEVFKDKYLRSKKNKKGNNATIHTVLLDNGSKLIYQKYIPYKKKLKDVYWIKSIDDIWHIKSLTTDNAPPHGRYIDHFQRGENGKLLLSESFKSYAFFDINFDKSATAAMAPYENRSISILYNQNKNERFSSSKERAHILTQLHYKLAMPLLPFMAVFALMPICIKFSRSNKMYIIALFSLIFFIGLYILLDAATILAMSNICHPSILIWTPFLLPFIYFIIRFYKNN